MAMEFIRAISATCDDILEDVIESDLSTVQLVPVRFQEQLEELLTKDSKFNVLLFKDTFPLNCHALNFIKDIKENYPHIRVVFIMTTLDEQDIYRYTTYLNSKQVYDIIHDSSFGTEELISALFNPKTATDALSMAKNVSFDEEFKILNTMENKLNTPIDEQSSGDAQDIDINYNNGIKYSYPAPKTIAFWSPKGGCGVDTLAINTAFMLAKNTNVDVCIADLSETPNMHLHLNMADTGKNIETLYIQQATGKLNVYTVDNFIVNGAETNFRLPNLHLLPGAIKRINFYKKMESTDGPNFVGNCLEAIIDTLREKYTIVILILSSNFTLPTYAGLRKCSQINMVLENSASCFYNANRYLHNEYGIFNASKIDSSKCNIVFNKMYVQDTFYIDNFLKMNSLTATARVGLYPEEAYSSFKTANPISFFESNDSIMMDMLSVVNTITYMDIARNEESVSEKKGLLGSIFKGKK